MPTFFFVTPTQSMVTEAAQKKNYLIFKKNKSLIWWVRREAVTYKLHNVNNESVCPSFLKEHPQTLQANKTAANSTAFPSHPPPVQKRITAGRERLAGRTKLPLVVGQPLYFQWKASLQLQRRKCIHGAGDFFSKKVLSTETGLSTDQKR